ncbi:type VI secretion system Vgr family protein [Sphaerotilus sulfidivorans]|uniref:type VI secretion system Vgr family protein n=1 Tax=Sphaerotilus sp. FB-3 TaxID=2913396 RepID=UPI0020423256|nr:type VI secretion system tip protein VgrG [Sphaerotilus sp. FB-3]GKQ56986.1 hypothetical protein QMTAC487_08440 [Sphaerotilus sp. FB-3]
MPAPPITFHCPLPPADLLFESMSVEAGLGRIGEMRLHLLSLKPDLAPDDLLGQPVRVELVLRDGSLRHWSGHCIRFGLGKPSGRHYGYDMTVRPWPWFLTRTSDCRIFQDLSVPDIVRQVLADHAVAKTDFRLFRSYAPRGYCVQYRESDFDFIARLLEQEGISWFFQHDAGGATLVLVDAAGAHDPAPGAERIAYYDVPGQAPPDVDCLWDWSFSHGVRTGRIALTDYDFERPSASLRVSRERGRSHEQADLERFDYPGLYRVTGDGEQYADNRLDEQQARHAGARGTTSAQSLAEGCRFTLERHPRDDQNTDYLVTAIRTRLHLDAYESGSTGGTELSSQIEVIPHAQQFRPPRLTPKPFVQGPQTAVVVGPAGEEIHTDKYGRVKVQFHWDRYGQKDERSSCWIRVSHPWAGKNWGAVSIPRIGQEVVVSFLEGDPDQPLITGRVYNAEQMPPYGLPAGAVVSGIKSNTHKGRGYNEFSMDDTAGKEKITVHAQYDMNTTVEHDQTNTVHNTFTETIKSHAAITITEGTYRHDVKANTANYHVQGALTETYDTTQTTTVKNDITVQSTSGPILVQAHGNQVHVEAATNIVLHVGASRLSMDAAGNIELSGVNVTVKGTAAVAIKGGVVTSEADTTHQTKGAIVLSEGAATNTVKGGMVMLNP